MCQASKQAYDVMSPKTRASNLPQTRDKPKQKKPTNIRIGVYMEEGLHPLQEILKNIHKL